MKSATISQAKDRLSALIDQVRAGDSIVITDRGVPVARLDPVTTVADPTGRLRRLERAGVVRIGTAAPPIERLREPGPAVAPDASAVAVLLEERRAGR